MTNFNWWHLGFWAVYVAAGISNFALLRKYYLLRSDRADSVHILSLLASVFAWPLFGAYAMFRSKKE